MGTTLTGQTRSSTYDAILKVTDNGPLGGTAKVITDGLGNDSVLKLGTAGAELTGPLTLAGLASDLPIADGGTAASTATLARAALNKGETSLTDAATIATDCSLGNVFTVTLGGNRTLGAPSNLSAGATYVWRFTQDGTGSRTLAYNAVFKFPGGTAPTLTTTAGAVDIISGVTNGTNVYCSFLPNLS